MTYSSGETFQNANGWYAQWNEDVEAGEANGPFPTEEEAAEVFLA